MFPNKVSFTIHGKKEMDVVRHINTALEDNKPAIRDTSEGNQKIVVLGWAIVILPQENDVLLVMNPLWVNDVDNAAINLTYVLSKIFRC